MASWDIFGSLLEILISNFFGSHAIFSVLVIGLTLIGFLAVGLPLRYALPMLIPLGGGIAAANYFGATNYVFPLILIIVGLIYGYSIIKLTT